MKKGKYFFLLLLFFAVKSHGQQQPKITVKDVKDIKFAAIDAISNLQGLLTQLTNVNNSTNDCKEFVEASMSQSSGNRIFESKTMYVADDIDPAATPRDSTYINIVDYFNKLAVQYVKTEEQSIKFSNVVASYIKMKEFLFINVKYDSKFGSTNNVITVPYTTKQRQATIKLEKIGNNWSALITGLAFYDPAKPIDDTTNNVNVYADTSATATPVTQESIADEVSSFVTQKQAEEKKKLENFNKFISLGDEEVASKQYKNALESYANAKSLYPLDPALGRKIHVAQILAAEYTYDKFKIAGDRALKERRLQDANKAYQTAQGLDAAKGDIIRPLLDSISKQTAIITSPNSKLESSLFDQAIQECEAKITARENKKTPEKFPELFFIEGKAYEKLAEQKPDDKSYVEKALKYYGSAITYAPNYLEARIARSNFYIKYKNDYPSAIADYDFMIPNTPDGSPEKPGYYITRAKMNDKRGTTDAALKDYTSAIALDKVTASYHFDKGELLYRLGKYPEAQLQLDTAIKLNTKYKDALYYRGLNYVGLKNTQSAGEDFIAAEKMGFEPYQLTKVDSISHAFFLAGDGQLTKRNFDDADTQFDNAIKIRQNNALAWHGKAEIQFIKAQESANISAAKDKYLASIALNIKATNNDKNFSDAHYRIGLAHHRTGDYDLALNAYNEAVRSNDQNALAFTERGNTYQVLKKYDKAAEDYAQAIAILKTDLEQAKKSSKDSLAKSIVLHISAVQQLNGQALYYNSDYAGAILVLDPAIDNNNNNAEALYYRGLTHVQQADFSKAFRDYNAAIKIKPEYKYFYANAQANYTNKNYDQAIINYTGGIKNDSLKTLKTRFYLRGMAYFKNKNIDSTLYDFAAYEKEGVVSTDTSFYADCGLAKLYSAQDSLATLNAITYLNKALTVTPKSAKVFYSLGCAYGKLGQFDKSLSYMEKAFADKVLVKDDISLPEKTFISNGPLWKDKASKTKYNLLKSQSGL